MMRRFTLLIALVGCIAALGIAGCGSSSSSSSSSASSAASSTTGTKKLATTKFVLHAGLGFGAFHRWIYKPVKAGDLKHPFSHKVTLVKAGLAALFVYHELKLAAANAQSSKILRPLVAPLTAAADKLKSLKSSLTNGSVNPSDIDSVNSQLGSINSTASTNGQSITESIPSLSQLTAGSTS